MTEISPRRRFTSRALLVGGALALPLTASITYAETIGQEIEAPMPPNPPTPPAASDAPLPPTPPKPGEFDDETREEIAAMEQELDEMQDEVAEVEREIVKDGQRQVIRIRRSGSPDDGAKKVERTVTIRKLDIDPADRAAMDKKIAEFRARHGEVEFDAEAMRASVEAIMEATPRFVTGCLDGQKDTVATRIDADGRKTMVVCQANAFSMARSSIMMARRAIERDQTLPEEARADALRSMDEALAEVEASRLEAGGA